MSEQLSTPLDHCRFNMQKGLRETHPMHWVERRVLSILVAFPRPLDLERGVSEDGGREE